MRLSLSLPFDLCDPGSTGWDEMLPLRSDDSEEDDAFEECDLFKSLSDDEAMISIDCGLG